MDAVYRFPAQSQSTAEHWILSSEYLGSKEEMNENLIFSIYAGITDKVELTLDCHSCYFTLKWEAFYYFFICTSTFVSLIARLASFLCRATIKGYLYEGPNNFQRFLFQAIKAEIHYSLSKAFRK